MPATDARLVKLWVENRSTRGHHTAKQGKKIVMNITSIKEQTQYIITSPSSSGVSLLGGFVRLSLSESKSCFSYI